MKPGPWLAALAVLVSGACTAAPSTTAGTATREPASYPPVDATVVSRGIAFSTQDLMVPAGRPFAILHRNEDRGVPHDIDVRTKDGMVVADTETIDGGRSSVYRYPALAAGTYVFICSVHPIPAMTGTITAE
jgi:plastocyanin